MAEQFDLSHFEKSMIIREMNYADIDAILEMQRLCFPGMDPWKEEQLRSHLGVFPKARWSLS